MSHEELPAAHQRLLPTSTADTTQDALLQARRVKARREEVEALAAMQGMDLAKSDVMARAWRP